MDRSLSRLLPALLLLAAACSDAKPGSLRKVPAPAPKLAEPVLERDPLPLAERLSREASENPAARQRVEDDLRSFEQAGVKIVRTRQVLGRPLAAQYCATALTAAGLGLSLCAFADDPQAHLGRTRSEQSFGTLIPGRTLLVQRATLLTLTRSTSEQTRDEAELIRARFMAATSAERAAL